MSDLAYSITEDEDTSLQQVAATLDVMMALAEGPPRDNEELTVLKLSMVNTLWMLRTKLEAVTAAYHQRSREAYAKSNPANHKIFEENQAQRNAELKDHMQGKTEQWIAGHKAELNKAEVV